MTITTNHTTDPTGSTTTSRGVVDEYGEIFNITITESKVAGDNGTATTTTTITSNVDYVDELVKILELIR